MNRRASLELTHHHPGRLRVRSDVLRRASDRVVAMERFDRVRAVLVAMTGVRSVTFNPQSGSVLVEYEPGVVDPNVLIDAVAHATDLDPPSAEPERPPQRRAAPLVIAAARKVNAFANELTGGRADLHDLVPMAMTGLAAYSFFVKKDRLPRWDNLAYWAYSVFSDLHAADIVRREARDE